MNEFVLCRVSFKKTTTCVLIVIDSRKFPRSERRIHRGPGRKNRRMEGVGEDGRQRRTACNCQIRLLLSWVAFPEPWLHPIALPHMLIDSRWRNRALIHFPPAAKAPASLCLPICCLNSAEQFKSPRPNRSVSVASRLGWCTRSDTHPSVPDRECVFRDFQCSYGSNCLFVLVICFFKHTILDNHVVCCAAVFQKGELSNRVNRKYSGGYETAILLRDSLFSCSDVWLGTAVLG